MRKLIQSIPSSTLAYISLVVALLCWTGNILLVRAMVGEIPPLALSFWRWLLAFFILFLFNAKHVFTYRRAIIINWQKIALLAFFSIVGYNAIFYIAAQTTTSANITLMGASAPIISGFMAHWILKEKLDKSRILGILISLVGVIVIIAKGTMQNLVNLQFSSGDLLMLLAVLSWSIYSIYLRKWNIHLPPIVLLSIITFLGTIGLFPLYYWESMHHLVYVFHHNHLYVFLYLALFPSIIAYLLWMYTIKHLKQTVVAQFAYLQIIFTSTLAYLFLGEHLSLFHLAGGTLIVAGLYFSHQTSTNALNHTS